MSMRVHKKLNTLFSARSAETIFLIYGSTACNPQRDDATELYLSNYVFLRATRLHSKSKRNGKARAAAHCFSDAR